MTGPVDPRNTIRPPTVRNLPPTSAAPIRQLTHNTKYKVVTSVPRASLVSRARNHLKRGR